MEILIEIAYIGRSTPTKGLDVLLRAVRELRDIEIKLHVFSDICCDNEPNIDFHGWVEPLKIWEHSFSHVVLPMLAPETYSFALHEAKKYNRSLIINRNNWSLTTQIEGNYLSYGSYAELLSVLSNLGESNEAKFEYKLVKRRSFWKKMSGV